MKTICLIALLVVPGGGMLRAQTNHAAVKAPPRAPTLISSDSADFDLNSTPHRAFYYGHVLVNDPQMKLSSAKMVADLPSSGGHISRIVAETNVVVEFLDEKGKTNHAICDQAVYAYSLQKGVTNETVTLSGHASVTNADGSWIMGEPLVWDRANNKMYGSNQVMSIKQNIGDVVGNTNSAAPKKTSASPGTIENIDRITLPSQP